jgi:hypothetical protein
MARRHPVATRRLTRRGHATRRRPRRGLTLQRHEHGVPKSDCRPRHPVASVGEENPCPWWCSGSIRTSSPIRPPPWPPGHSNSSAAFGSPPAPPAMSSCWAGPDSSRNGAGRSRTPADWAAISPSGCSLVGRPSRTCAPPPPHGSGSCRAGVVARHPLCQAAAASAAASASRWAARCLTGS